MWDCGVKENAECELTRVNYHQTPQPNKNHGPQATTTSHHHKRHHSHVHRITVGCPIRSRPTITTRQYSIIYLSPTTQST